MHPARHAVQTEGCLEIEEVGFELVRDEDIAPVPDIQMHDAMVMHPLYQRLQFGEIATFEHLLVDFPNRGALDVVVADGEAIHLENALGEPVHPLQLRQGLVFPPGHPSAPRPADR